MSSPIDFYQVSLKLFLKNEEGKILVMPTPIERHQQGRYDVPGGRINEDEIEVPFEQILRREVAEELGDDILLDISSDPVAIGRNRLHAGQEIESSPARSGKDIPILFVFFAGTYRGGEIKIDEDHRGFDWIDPTDTQYINKFIPGIYDALQRYKARQI